jgi:hypothetical protein
MHHLSGRARQCRVGAQRCCAPPQGTSHPCRQGRCGGSPLRTTLFSAFSLPCEIRTISQGRPCSASEHTRSVERKQGKGVVRGFPGGAPHPASPAERRRGPSRPPRSQESFCMTNHARTLVPGFVRISAFVAGATGKMRLTERAFTSSKPVFVPPKRFLRHFLSHGYQRGDRSRRSLICL